MTVSADLEILRNTIGSASGTTHGRMESALDAIHRLISALAETTATELTSTDNAIARFDGTEGALQDSAASVNNSGDITGRNLVASVSVFTGNDFSFDEESDSPQLNQVASAVDSATGYHMIVKAQSCTGATSTGGDLRLKGGAGTSANGATQLMDASNNVLLQAGPADNALDALVPLGMAANDADSAPTGAAGDIAYFTNGDGGSPCLAVHNGTNWLRIALGTAVASS